uniref:Uncharacterized protein n=1 Tax=Rhizophora mucronata TaxID=61149 RepID=A0A2P2PRX8_RHIMU
MDLATLLMLKWGRMYDFCYRECSAFTDVIQRSVHALGKRQN